MFIRELFEKKYDLLLFKSFYRNDFILILLNNNDFYEINDGWLYV